MKAAVAILVSLFMAVGAANAQTGSSLNLSLQLSRTSGVAPLMVFFDSSATTTTATPRPFREVEYRWNFGDVEAKWENGSRAGTSSKNAATGAISAHVYESPGTYTVTLTAFDGRSTITRTATVTVSDPNTVFAGNKTVCISTGERGFEGCPGGAQQVSTSDFSTAIKTYGGTGKRLLFRRGETFSASQAASIVSDGPGIVGAFGPGDDPKPVLWSSANGNTLQFSSRGTPKMRDWRIMDLSLRGSANAYSAGVAMNGSMSQLTLLRLSMHRQRVGIMADSNVLDYWNKQTAAQTHAIWDQFAVVDCDVSEVNHGKTTGEKGYGSYLSGERLFFAGNHMDTEGSAASDVSHVTRFTYLGKAVIANNTLMRPGPTEHVIKIHAPAWGANTSERNGVGKGYTRWVIVADNKIVGASNAWLVAIGPQNNGRDERVLEVVSERNWFIAGPGMQVAQIIWATAVTVRNNIVDSSNGSTWQAGVTVGKRGIEPAPQRVGINNNTFYTTRQLSRGHFAGINLESAARDITARNNVAYAPNASSPAMFSNACGTCLREANNSADILIKSKSPFEIASPVTPADFAAASYAVEKGTAVPNWSDFFMATVPNARNRDIGAVSRR